MNKYVTIVRLPILKENWLKFVALSGWSEEEACRILVNFISAMLDAHNLSFQERYDKTERELRNVRSLQH